MGKPSGIAGANLTPDKAAYSEGDQIEFKCKPKHVPSGNGKSTCTNGQFSTAMDLTCTRKYTYTVVKSAKNWFEARKHCQNLGGDLANHGIESAADRKAALAHFKLKGTYYIGFWDKDFQTEWTTVAGKPFDMKSFGWDKKQPQGGKENVAVWYTWSNLVHDWPTSAKKHFICEVKQYNKPTAIAGGSFTPVKAHYLKGETITFKCDPKHDACGKEPAPCQGGEFKPAINFKCLKQCDKPSGIAGASLTPDKAAYSEGDQIEFKCDPKHDAKGNGKSTCTNGKFSPAIEFKCTKQCDKPSGISGASLNPDKAAYS